MKNRTILLIEDNEDDILLTKRALKNKKILNDIVVAEDGVEALDYLKGTNGKEQVKPILILLDLKLPKLDGLQVLEFIRRNSYTCNTPVVVLTTSSEEEDILKSYKLGANSYIRKPVNFGQFSNAIEQVGLYWLALNQNIPD